MSESFYPQATKSSINIHENEKVTFSRFLDNLFRRTLDIIISFLGLLFLSPVLVCIAVAIKQDSPGPVLFHGRRVGANGREFKILKFRTMVESSASYKGLKITGQGDSRITQLGHRLRDTKLNELPQLWNVLVGNMSFVGPRPEDPEIVAAWPDDYKRIILSVRPGITSPASIVYKNEESLLVSDNVMDEYLKKILPSKLRLDTLYVRNRNVITDLDVIFWTSIALLPKLREFSIPKSLLYWGPFSQFFTRYVTWWFIDSLTAFFALSISGAIWRTSAPLNIGMSRSLLYALLFAFTFGMVNWLLGMNRIEWSRASASEAVNLAMSSVLAMSMVFLINSNLRSVPLLPNHLIILSATLAFIGFVVTRYRERLITGLASRWANLRKNADPIGEKLLIIGAGENGILASWLFHRNDFGKAFHVVGFVDDDPKKQGMKFDGHPVLGTTEILEDLTKKQDIGVIIFTIDNIDDSSRRRILSICKNTNAKIVLLPNILQGLREELRVNSSPCEENSTLMTNNVVTALDKIDELIKKGDIQEAQKKLLEVRDGLGKFILPD